MDHFCAALLYSSVIVQHSWSGRPLASDPSFQENIFEHLNHLSVRLFYSRRAGNNVKRVIM